MNCNMILKKFQRMFLKLHRWKNSTDYWERRYNLGGDSGSGSYNRLALFKSEIINDFVKKYNIHSIIEWGCGDGEQLKLAKYPQYVGIDVSSKVIEKCKAIFKNDTSKCFYCNGAVNTVPDEVFEEPRYDLALSLDVLYHLVEDEIFEQYMEQLFASSKQYVCIYSCNFEKKHEKHVRCRKFSDYIVQNMTDWQLIKKIPNRYPYDSKDKDNTSWSDFYFYKRI